MIGIYRVVSPTGATYIGQSWKIEKRFSGYKGGWGGKFQPSLYSSFKKYGTENHSFEILHLLPLDVEQSVMNQYEKAYFDAHKDLGIRMMNIRECGSKGKLSPETIKKLSAINRGKKITEETRQKLRIARAKNGSPSKGKKWSAEARKKRSEQRKKAGISPENRIKMADGLRGKKKSFEHIQNMLGKTGPKKGHKHSAETIEKIRKARIDYNKLNK